MKKLFLFSIFMAFGISAVKAVDFAEIMELRADNSAFSPNGDGLQDNLFFTPILKSEWDISRWRMEIFSSKGKLVQRYTGAGFSSLIQWDGRDKKGALLPEGEYQVLLSEWGPGFKIKSEPKAIIIDNTPPTAELSVSTTGSDAVYVFTPTLQDNGTIDRWQFQILGATGRTVYLEWSTGPVKALMWDGHDRSSGLSVPTGPYRAVLQAWDKAGNESPGAISDFHVAVPANAEMKNLIKQVRPIVTPAGLLVQLTAKDLFVFVKGKPELRKRALPVLNEVSLLLNSYPSAQVRVDGYCFAYGQSAKDRDISSLYAWGVYSYFVKQGNVQASRLTVRGRGRVAPEDRVNAKIPYVQNGIEVILVGQDRW